MRLPAKGRSFFSDSSKRSARKKKEAHTGEERDDQRRVAPFLLSESMITAKGNTLYMPVTFPKYSVHFFAATGAARVACDERVSDSVLRVFEINTRAKHNTHSTHALSSRDLFARISTIVVDVTTAASEECILHSRYFAECVLRWIKDSSRVFDYCFSEFVHPLRQEFSMCKILLQRRETIYSLD